MGLEFRVLRAFNLTLLGKQWWRLTTVESSLASRLFKVCYFQISSLRSATLGFRPSFAWRSILQACNAFDSAYCWHVGNGESIRLWEDRWVQGVDDLTAHKDRLGNSQLTMVVELMNLDGTWNRGKVFTVFPPGVASHVLNIPLSVRRPHDMLMWPHTADGVFSVKSGIDAATRSLPSSSSGIVVNW